MQGRGPALLRFAYLLTGDSSRAEDLVQEALLRAHGRWGTGALANPEAYVRRIIANGNVSWWRRRSSHEQVGVVRDAAVSDGSQARADRDAVWDALGALPRRQRAVLVLRYYEAIADRDIAQILGCAEGTVRSLAARAFATLRADNRLAAAANLSDVCGAPNDRS